MNVISYDWFNHYHQAVRDYSELKHPIKKYYKSASFAIEWLLTTVILNLKESKFDLQPLVTVRIQRLSSDLVFSFCNELKLMYFYD